MGRALLPGIAASLGFGLVFGQFFSFGAWPLAFSAFFLLLAAWRKFVPFLWAASFFLGLELIRPVPFPKHLELQLPLLRECTGIVVDLPEPTAKRLSFTVELESLGVRLLAYGPQDVLVYPGQRVRLFGRCGVPEPAGWREYLARRGIYGLFWADRMEVLSESKGGLLFWTAQARETLRSLLFRLPERARALLSALLLGSRGLLSTEDKEAFRQAGVAHLLALSGLHVGILVAGGWFLLRLLRFPRAWRYFLLIPAVGFYVLIGGLRVSLLRAGVMFGVVGVFWMLWERGLVAKAWLDPLQGLSLAGLIVFLIWPWSVMDAAFQLSFSATAGIIILLPSWTNSPLRRRLPRIPRYFLDLVVVSACAQLGVIPFLTSTFGYLAPYGLLANLVLIPWTTVLLWAGILGLPFLAIPQTQVGAGCILAGLSEPYLWVVERLGKLPGAVLPVGEGFGLWYLLALLSLLILRAAQEEFLFPLRPKPRPHPAWPG